MPADSTAAQVLRLDESIDLAALRGNAMAEPSEAHEAAQAFEDLRAEVSVLRRAVEGLSSEWQNHRPPDYTETLGEMAKSLEEVHFRLDDIEGHPALQLTPTDHQKAVSAAGATLMGPAAERLAQAAQATEHTQRALAGVMGVARARHQQLKWLLWTAGAALLVGLLLSPLLARLLPFGLDGRVAALTMRTDRWNAGAALMQAGSPEGWDGILNDLNLAKLNQGAVAVCRAAASRARKSQPCTLIVPAADRGASP